MGRGMKTFGTTLVAGIAAVAVCAPIAGADTTAPTWNCRASTLYALNQLLPLPTLGLVRVEPIVANGQADPDHPDNASCVTDEPILHHLNIGGTGSPATGGLLDADAAAADTAISPEIGNARDQTVFAAANVTNITLTLGGAVIKIAAAGAQATARCIGGNPELQGSSTIAHVEVNGQLIPIDDGLAQLATALAPLSALLQLEVNKQTVTGDANSDSQTLVQQALVIKVLQPALTIVLGEAKVKRQGRTCDGADQAGPPNSPQLPPNTPPQTNSGPTGPTTPSVVFVPVQVPVTTASNTTTTAKVEVNGTNGGCGTVKMFFDANKSKANRTFNSTFGQRVVTRGRLVSCSGKPIIGGRVDVYHLIRGHKKRLRKTGIRSRPGGLVTLILPLNLTSRKIFYEYRGNLASSHVNSRSTLTLNVFYKGKIISKLPPGQPKPRF